MPLIDSVMSGINATCFAYGMTGSGKTHTMLGDIYHTSTGEAGVCTQAISELFSRIHADAKNDYDVRASYLEIYNEQVRDLLCAIRKNKYGLGLLIVEDPVKGVIVPELTEYSLTTAEDLLELMLKGNQLRTMAETRANQFSSRSHAIINITIEARNKVRGVTDEVSVAKLCIVDLAGCERAAVSSNRGIRMLEGGKINRSLLALGNCINMLSDKAKASSSFIPYRDSKLTRLLKDSLGGNTKTVMIACVSPGDNCYEETVNTLKYAERAKRINKKISKNVREVAAHVAEYKEIISSLRAEITTLRTQLLGRDGAVPYTLTLSTSVIKTKELEAIDEEILKAREMKVKLEGEKVPELAAKPDPVLPGAGTTAPAPTEETPDYLDKLSSKLMSKYEEQYEMKQSLNELHELNTKNQEVLSSLQSQLDRLVRARKEPQPIPAEGSTLESEIGKQMDDIVTLRKNIESNEEVRRGIERSQQENAEVQKQVLAALEKVRSDKKRDVIELQITVRSLRLEKIDLVMQNLEMKKRARMAELDREGKDKEIEAMRKELVCVREQLRGKELELQQTRVVSRMERESSCYAGHAPKRTHLEIRLPRKSPVPRLGSRDPVSASDSFLAGTERSGSRITPRSPMIVSICNINRRDPEGRNSGSRLGTRKSDVRGQTCRAPVFGTSAREGSNGSHSSRQQFCATAMSPLHLDPRAALQKASPNTTRLGSEEDPSEVPERRKSFVVTGTKKQKRSSRNPEQRETICIKAVLESGSYSQRALQKAKQNEVRRSQKTLPKTIAISLRQYCNNCSSTGAIPQFNAKAQDPAPAPKRSSRPRRAKIALDTRESEAQPGEVLQNRNSVDKPIKRSISLKLNVNELRDRRKLEQTRKFELSLAPMKEVIEEMASTLHKRFSNADLSEGARSRPCEEEKLSAPKSRDEAPTSAMAAGSDGGKWPGEAARNYLGFNPAPGQLHDGGGYR